MAMDGSGAVVHDSGDCSDSRLAVVDDLCGLGLRLTGSADSCDWRGDDHALRAHVSEFDHVGVGAVDASRSAAGFADGSVVRSVFAAGRSVQRVA